MLRTLLYEIAYRCTLVHYTTGLTGLYSASIFQFHVEAQHGDLNAIEICCTCLCVFNDQDLCMHANACAIRSII